MKQLLILGLIFVGVFAACKNSTTTTPATTDSVTVASTDSLAVESSDTTATDSIN